MRVSVCVCWFFGLISFFKKIIYLFLERGEGREKVRERNINVWLPLAHPLVKAWLATQACALTGNQTGDPLLSSPVLSPLSHTSQGLWVDFLSLNIKYWITFYSLTFWKPKINALCSSAVNIFIFLKTTYFCIEILIFWIQCLKKKKKIIPYFKITFSTPTFIYFSFSKRKYCLCG